MAPPTERPWNLWDESPPPLPVENGIAAIGETDRPTGGLGGSVVRRVLERSSPGIATRGRAYARAGQTISLTFARGRIAAEIQGSEPMPYLVEITCDVSDVDRDRFVRALHHALPQPVTSVPTSSTRDLRAELAEYRILLDTALTVRCNCRYRGVCKHMVALAYVAGERLDDSPANVAAMLGVTDDEVANPGPEPEPTNTTEPDVVVFDRRRQAQLARTLAALDRRKQPDRNEVLARAAEVLTPSAAVANALDLDLYLDPVDES
ncbi:MAG: SWIM zinc finger family protein [Acidimicrobiia bacterium]